MTGRRKMAHLRREWLGWVLGVVLALATWLMFYLAFGPEVVPSPLAAASELARSSRHYASNGMVTAGEAAGGLLISALLTAFIATAVGVQPHLEKLVYPFAVFVKATPAVALAPLVVVICGTGFAPKVVVAALIAFFPLLVGTLDGAKSVDTRLARVRKTYGATAWAYFRNIQFGFAIRGFLAGLKTAGPLAVVGAIVAEFVAGGDGGIGAALVTSQRNLQIPAVFAAASVAMVIGLVFFIAAELMASLADRRLMIDKRD